MKHKTKNLLFLTTLFLLSSCSKYEEGPLLSVIPRSNRIANKWKVSLAKINAKDTTAAYKNYIFEFTEKGTVITQIDSMKYIGIWQLNNSAKDLDIFYDKTLLPDSRNEILMLKNNELWLRNRNTLLELHLTPY